LSPVKTEHQVKTEENKAGPIKPKSSYFFYKNAKKEHFKVIVRVTNRSSPLSPQKFTTKDGAPWVRLFDIQDGMYLRRAQSNHPVSHVVFLWSHTSSSCGRHWFYALQVQGREMGQ
jgi:hypothetical protein